MLKDLEVQDVRMSGTSFHMIQKKIVFVQTEHEPEEMKANVTKW